MGDVQRYLKDVSRLYGSGRPNFFGHALIIPSVDEMSKVPEATFAALSGVAPASFWSPHKRVPLSGGRRLIEARDLPQKADAGNPLCGFSESAVNFSDGIRCAQFQRAALFFLKHGVSRGGRPAVSVPLIPAPPNFPSTPSAVRSKFPPLHVQP